MVSSKPMVLKKTAKVKSGSGKIKEKKKVLNKDKSLSKDDKKKDVVLKTLEENKPEVNITKTKVKFTMPSKYITETIAESCLSALDQVAACTQKKKSLFEDEQQIFAEINCLKIPTSKGNIKFVLRHSTAASTGEICLITRDLKKGRKIDHEPTVDYWQETLQKANVTSVKTILPIRQLKVEYDQYELKRRLLTQHDMILVDTRVLNHVSHILGKMFFKKHNMLIPVRVDEKHMCVKKAIDIGLRTTMLRLSDGPTSVILIGHTGMAKEKLKENIMSLVMKLSEKYPGGEANIRSISLKLPLSMSVPLYITLRPSSSIVNPPRLGKKKPKNFHDVEDELSTIPDSNVRIAPDGTVSLIKLKQRKVLEEENPGSEEEEDKNEDSDKDE